MNAPVTTINTTDGAAPATTPPLPHHAIMTPLQGESRSERIQHGKALRKTVPRSAHAQWEPPADRPDPISVLQASDPLRQSDLLPIRYGRMMESPFTFLRGSASVMACDLASTPTTDLLVQACGDAHLANFGIFATPERQLVFDLNDFDETLRGHWEWDIKRLAASLVVAGRTNGLSRAICDESVLRASATYRGRLAQYATMDYLALWYTQVNTQDVLDMVSGFAHKVAQKHVRKAQRRNHLHAFARLTEVVNGRVQLINDPPLLMHVSDPIMGDHIEELLAGYLASLREDRRELLCRYTLVDFARKVVGVGSVGTRCYVMLLAGKNQGDPLFLQMKEANASVIETYGEGRKSTHANHGQRVVRGQQMTQAASDIFLGFGHMGVEHYYVRQLRDMKGSVDSSTLTPSGFVTYAALCAWALARAHARSGDVVALTSYLGKRDIFDHALVAFANAYADQTERDHAALVAAVKSGRVKATTP
jgi:uncharacterized protein (DUF2252 family)